MTQAAQPEPADKAAEKAARDAKKEAAAKTLADAKVTAAKAAAAAEAAAKEPIGVVEGGRVAAQKTADAARKEGLTVVDLSDEWLPYVFSETPDKPQPLRPFLLDLANGRIETGKELRAPARGPLLRGVRDFPSLNMVRRRLADKKRHACHDQVKDGVLEELSAKNVIPPEELEKVPNPGPRDARGDADGHDRADNLAAAFDRAGKAGRDRDAGPPALRGHAARQGDPGRMDRRTAEGLKNYQHLHQLADNAKSIPRPAPCCWATAASRTSGRCCACCASASSMRPGCSRTARRRRRRARCRGASWTAPSSSRWPCRRTRPTAPAPAQPRRGAPARSGARRRRAPAKITPAPDLIAPATHAASRGAGLDVAGGRLASTLPPPRRRDRRSRARRPGKGPAPLPAAVAIRLPPLPPYHGPKMELRAEIDRGEVVLARPKLDKDGHKKWKPPVADRPTLTLFAKAGDHEVALVRWPTTIGGWKTFEKKDGTMALKYKESVTGEAVWPEVLATPTWHPAPGMPTRSCSSSSATGSSRRRRSSAPATVRPTGWSRSCTTRSWSGTRRASRSSWTSASARTARPATDRSSAARATAATACTTSRPCGCRRSWSSTTSTCATASCPRTTCASSTTRARSRPREREQGLPLQVTPPIPVNVLEGDVKGDAKAVKRMVPLAAVP